jgi:transcriptional regulator with XRE-family HTH domain
VREQPTRHLVAVSTNTAPPDRLWRQVAGAILRDRRLVQGRTLQQVATRAGVSPQYLSEIERGRKEPSSEMLASICGALGIGLADLLSAGTQLLGGASVVRLGRPGPRPVEPLSQPSGPVLLAG